jgi:uncharacterized protein (DUF2384 family)
MADRDGPEAMAAIPLTEKQRGWIKRIVSREEMQRIMTALAVYYTEEEARLWLCSPQRLLDGKTPSDMIEGGHVNRVWQVIDQLDSGAFL